MTTIAKFSGVHRFLSNFYDLPEPVFLADDEPPIPYRTTEHAFQAAKTLDRDERLRVASRPSPAGAKSEGKRVTLRPGWNEMRVEVMRGVLRQKFAPGTALAAALVHTGGAELQEGNTWNDTFWGVCRGSGQNHLGRLLMEIRDDLQAEGDVAV